MAASLVWRCTRALTLTCLLCSLLALGFVWRALAIRLSSALLTAVVLPALTAFVLYMGVVAGGFLLMGLALALGSLALQNVTDHVDQHGHAKRRRHTWGNGSRGHGVWWVEDDEDLGTEDVRAEYDDGRQLVGRNDDHEGTREANRERRDSFQREDYYRREANDNYRREQYQGNRREAGMVRENRVRQETHRVRVMRVKMLSRLLGTQRDVAKAA